MPRGKSSYDQDMLAMALVGYEVEKKKIEEKIKMIRARIGGSRLAAKASAPEAGEGRTRRKLSKAARKRIAAAQKKRWAEHRKAIGAKA